MLKSLMLCAAVALSLTACTDYQQSQIDTAQRDLTQDNFIVMTQPEYDDYGYIQIQYRGNDPLVVNNVTVNKGNCKALALRQPIQFKYGDVYNVHLYGCRAENVLSVQIYTESGEITYSF